LTKDQVDAVWDGWVAEKPSRAAFFPITVHGSSSESGEDEKDSE
jgi:hypothetical protein